MISDLTLASTTENLQEYYNKLYKLQSDAHGVDYMLVHDEIKERLKDCNSYTELGVNQGATLAVALLQKIKIVKAYDINLTPYNKAKEHFKQYTQKHNIDYIIYEKSTLEGSIDVVDMLYIDTLHQYTHLKNELKLHANKVKKYIIFHDTFAQKGLKKAIAEYIQNNKEWKIITDCEKSVGFITIERT